MTNFDFKILNWIQENFQNSFADSFWKVITFAGNGAFFWFVLIMIFIFMRKTRKMAITMFLSLLFCFLTLHFIFKGIVDRPRPFQQNPSFSILIGEPRGSSFPSGHTATSICMATILFLFRKENKIAKIIWIPCFIIALLIAFSRLYLYVHFPSDVLGGMIYGILCANTGFWIFKKQERKQ